MGLPSCQLQLEASSTAVAATTAVVRSQRSADTALPNLETLICVHRSMTAASLTAYTGPRHRARSGKIRPASVDSADRRLTGQLVAFRIGEQRAPGAGNP
jgi:hypothetical protein